jgi:hypothetical protein
MLPVIQSRILITLWGRLMDCCIPLSPLSPHHVSISLFHRYYCYSFGSCECCTRARPVAGPREREMCSLDVRRSGLIDECTIRELHGAKRGRQHDVYHSASTTVCALTHGVFGSRLSYSLSQVCERPSITVQCHHAAGAWQRHAP